MGGGAGNELSQKVRDVFLAFGHKRFFVAGSAAKRDNDCLLASRSRQRSKWGEAEERAARRRARGGAQKIPAAPGNRLPDFLRAAKASA